MNFKYFSTGQKIGGAEASISCAAFEKEGHFLSFRRDGHIVIYEESSYGGNNGGIAFLKGENKGE